MGLRSDLAFGLRGKCPIVRLLWSKVRRQERADELVLIWVHKPTYSVHPPTLLSLLSTGCVSSSSLLSASFLIISPLHLSIPCPFHTPPYTLHGPPMCSHAEPPPQPPPTPAYHAHNYHNCRHFCSSPLFFSYFPKHVPTQIQMTPSSDLAVSLPQSLTLTPIFTHAYIYILESLDAPEFPPHLLPKLKDTSAYLNDLDILHIYAQPPLPLPTCLSATSFLSSLALRDIHTGPHTTSG